MDTNVWTVGFATAVILFQLVAVPALLLKKNDLADVRWGPAFVISALSAALWGTADGLASIGTRSVVLLALLTIWAIRLFLHVGWRNLRHRSEDIRYNNWRKQWGRSWIWRSYLQVFVLQALILYCFLTPVLLSIASPQEPMSWVAWGGIATWLLGFFFESVADEQLRQFKANPNNKGALMTRGLWSWSRHPNYFGEVVQWWGLWLLVLDLPFGWATVVSPIGVTYLILKVSGVTMLEDVMKARPGYDEYIRRTSKFIPRPPAIPSGFLED